MFAQLAQTLSGPAGPSEFSLFSIDDVSRLGRLAYSSEAFAGWLNFAAVDVSCQHQFGEALIVTRASGTSA